MKPLLQRSGADAVLAMRVLILITCGVAVSGVTNMSTTVTSTTTTAHFEAVELCLADARCASCLDTINASTGIHSVHEWSVIHKVALFDYQHNFFDALLLNENCSDTPSTVLLRPALNELMVNFQVILERTAIARFGIATSPCTMSEYVAQSLFSTRQRG